MEKTTRTKINPKILTILAVGALIVATLFVGTQMGGGQDMLSEAVEGGELALTSMGRNHESLTQFVQENETQARQLLEAARLALENAKAKLNSARRTNDDYLLGMLDNYQKVAQASDVMAQGVDNLLAISENMTIAIDSYSQKNYDEASKQASYCLRILTPLLGDFETSDEALGDIDVFYIPSGQRDRLTLRTDQYKSEMEVYGDYILLLESLLRGKDYLKQNALLEDKMRQLQKAVASEDYQTAEALLQEISKILQSLKEPTYQDAADAASKLDPSLLPGRFSDVAEELKNRLRTVEGIHNFENYLQSLGKYLEALKHLEQGELTEAETAVNEGLGILGQGQSLDQELQGSYSGLREALNTLQLHIKGQPPPG